MSSQMGKLEAERGNWLVQRSTAASGLPTIQTGPWNFKPGVFLFVCFYFCTLSQIITSQRNLIQLKIGGKAVINPGKILYIK